MKILKSVFCIAISALFFANCKSSIVKIPVPKGSEKTIDIIAKKGKLSENEMNTWSHADLKEDSISGMSISKAYDFLKGKKGVEVIVAIADSGVDIEHEDLRDVIWVNPNEIVGNNKDDDNNGYVDDMHGWNFLGDKDGSIITADQLEITRIVKKGMDEFGTKKASEIPEKDKSKYEAFLKHKETYTKAVEGNKKEIENIKKTQSRLNQIMVNFAAVKKFMAKDSLSVEELEKLTPKDSILAAQISDITNLLKGGMNEKGLIDYKENLSSYLKKKEKGKHYNLNFTLRESISDDLNDINDTDYGNNNVIGSKTLEHHGTHVAGIVAASRNNKKGVNGVANNAKIMTVRVVPDGDEHDKDIALGIRYAVDNGAKIINMSFGKRYSPNFQWVLDAIKYAAKKDVLLVSASGNSSKNIDQVKVYPNDTPGLKNEIIDNVLTIGAIGLKYNKNLPAGFSNYGKINVDIFAPGQNIYSTMPQDTYASNSGTSMAAPAVAGIAALIRSYYPQLSASQVKHIIINSGTKINFEVIKPGSATRENPKGVLVSFSDLSASGRIVNAYSALKMADRIVNGKK